MKSSAVIEIQGLNGGADADTLSLGQRLRALRLKRGITVEAAATEAKISKSALSKIENGKMSPTYEILMKIVHAYGQEVANLFSIWDTTEVEGVAVTKTEDEKIIKSKHIIYKLHASSYPARRFDPLHCNILFCEDPEDMEWNRHDGQEFLYVISGTVELRLKPNRTIVLRGGESVYLDSEMPHAVRSLVEPSSEVIWIAATNSTH